MKRESSMEPHLRGPALTPSARLAASHDALAHYLRGDTAPNTGTGGTGDGPGTGGGAAAAPSINANLAVALANNALAPLARDHPWALVGTAAAAGALIASRRWRKVLQPLIVAGWLSPVLSRWATRALVQNLSRRLLGPDPGRTR